jgi:hypothetical protein
METQKKPQKQLVWQDLSAFKSKVDEYQSLAQDVNQLFTKLRSFHVQPSQDLFEKIFRKGFDFIMTACQEAYEERLQIIPEELRESIPFNDHNCNKNLYPMYNTLQWVLMRQKLDWNFIKIDSEGNAHLPAESLKKIKEQYEVYVENPVQAQAHQLTVKILDAYNDLLKIVDQNGYDLADFMHSDNFGMLRRDLATGQIEFDFRLLKHLK